MKQAFLFLLILLVAMFILEFVYPSDQMGSQPQDDIMLCGESDFSETVYDGTEETDPVIAEPTQPEPRPTEPAETKPKPTEPAETKPKPTEPAETEPKPTEPAETEPKPTEPAETEPKPTEPAETRPKPTEPAETEPKPTEPAETRPKPTEPAETTPNPTEPPETKPTEPEPTTPTPTQGWTEKDGKRYYLNKDGKYHTGWLKLDGERYYFLKDGTMATGCVEIPELGKRYFTSSGKEVVMVNPWNFVPEEYSVTLGSYSGYKMAKHIISPLKQMLADCKAAGHTAIVSSAYRSHQDQIYLHNRRIQRFLDQGYSEEDAKREAARRVAVPGTSEHELGLALDIVDINYQNLTEKQETMPAQQWLIKNSWKYGFILRYPNEKSDVTGIIYEPWHYRYVGEELAAEIHKSGLCLEEYLAQLTK